MVSSWAPCRKRGYFISDVSPQAKTQQVLQTQVEIAWRSETDISKFRNPKKIIDLNYKDNWGIKKDNWEINRRPGNLKGNWEIQR